MRRVTATGAVANIAISSSNAGTAGTAVRVSPVLSVAGAIVAALLECTTVSLLSSTRSRCQFQAIRWSSL